MAVTNKMVRRMGDLASQVGVLVKERSIELSLEAAKADPTGHANYRVTCLALPQDQAESCRAASRVGDRQFVDGVAVSDWLIRGHSSRIDIAE